MLGVFLGDLQVWMERVSEVRDPESFSSRIASLLFALAGNTKTYSDIFLSSMCVHGTCTRVAHASTKRIVLENLYYCLENWAAFCLAFKKPQCTQAVKISENILHWFQSSAVCRGEGEPLLCKACLGYIKLSEWDWEPPKSMNHTWLPMGSLGWVSQEAWAMFAQVRGMEFELHFWNNFATFAFVFSWWKKRLCS